MTRLVLAIALMLGVAAAPAIADDAGTPADTGSGSAVVTADTGSAAQPAPAPAASPTSELADLKAKYQALKAATPDVKLLAWAALIAAVLKLGLSLFNRYLFKETKRWTKWVALGAAVPIALLSYYGLGHTLLESLIFAGAGPGAIIVHELLPSGTSPPKEPAVA